MSAAKEERERALNAKVAELHARDQGAALTLEQLREAPRAVREGYRRRREREERAQRLLRQRQAEERRKRRDARKQRRRMRMRRAGAARVDAASPRARGNGLGRDDGAAMTQLRLGEVFAGGALASDTQYRTPCVQERRAGSATD